ncbi:hypothetical protein SUGI_0815100 [Cryptomeria japonica]|nr:hypothetical protein SUGI_0815100 [Cryptomeria japonica]
MGMSKKAKRDEKVPTIFVSAEPSNFRSVVQKFTGRPVENTIEGSLLLKPVPKRPEAKQLSANSCQWLSSLSSTSSESQRFSPQVRSSLSSEYPFIDLEEDEKSSSVSDTDFLMFGDFLDLHNDISVGLDVKDLWNGIEGFLE